MNNFGNNNYKPYPPNNGNQYGNPYRNNYGNFYGNTKTFSDKRVLEIEKATKSFMQTQYEQNKNFMKQICRICGFDGPKFFHGVES